MGEQQEGLAIVLTTLPSQDEAKKMAETLIKERVVACVSFLEGVFSVYMWKGNLEKALEVLLWLKVPERALSKAKERVLALHPYEVPELITLKASDVNEAYLSWALKEAHPE
jgi:periplasmic divalent cation tolerance protein